MQSFSQYTESTFIGESVVILDLIQGFNENAEVEVNEGYMSIELDSLDDVNNLIAQLPEDIEYDAFVSSTSDIASASLDEDDEGYVLDDVDNLNEDSKFELVIYTDNTDSVVEQLDEVRRRVKVSAKGGRRIKMQCKKGFKWDGRQCVKISGTEKINKTKAIRKAVRTKRSKGSGFDKRVARLRNRALKKRKSMGIRNFKS